MPSSVGRANYSHLFNQKPITRSLELQHWGCFSGCPGCQRSNLKLLWFHIRIGEVHFRFCVCRWREAFHSVNLSFHQAFNYMNLSNKCFFTSNQIDSNVTKYVLEAGERRSRIVVKQHNRKLRKRWSTRSGLVFM